MTATLDGLLAPVAERAAFAFYVGQMVGLAPQLTSGFRSLASQAQLFNQYQACLRAGATVSPANPDPACRYPANAPGDSSHNWGLAFDSWVPDGQWDAWTSIRTQLGFIVPGSDRVHAEVPEWRAVRDALVALGYYPNAYRPPAVLAPQQPVQAPIAAPAIPAPAPAPPAAPAAPQAQPSGAYIGADGLCHLYPNHTAANVAFCQSWNAVKHAGGVVSTPVP